MLQLIEQSGFQCPLMFAAELLARGFEIEHIDRHLPFGINQGNFDIAVLLGQTGTDAVQNSWTVLSDYLKQSAMRRAFVIKVDSGLNSNFGYPILLSPHA